MHTDATPAAGAPEPVSAPSDAEPRARSTKTTGRRVWAVVAALSLLALGGAGLATLRSAPPPEASQPQLRVPVVQTGTATAGSIPLIGEYRGELIAEVAELAARSSGRLLLVNGKIGDTFSKGDLLARIDALEPQRQLAEASAQLQAAEAALQRVDAQLAAARIELERGQRLRAESLMSEQELTALASQVRVLEAETGAAQAQKASAQARVKLFREQIADARLIAPFDGAIAERYLDPGSNVQPNTPILRLVRRGPLRARFRVPERDLRHLRVGSELHVTTQATSTLEFPGKLERVSAEVSWTDRTVAAEGLLAEEHDVLRPGMYAHVKLTFGTLDDATLVPSSAVFERIVDSSTPETSVFVIEDGKAHLRPVTVVAQHGDRSAVEGIPVGAVVVSFGHEAVRDGGPVRVVEEKLP